MAHFYRKSHKVGCIIALAVLCLSNLSAQAQPGILWQKPLGGSKSDEAWDVRLTTDGGYIVVGSSTSNDGDLTNNKGVEDLWVIKLASNGALEWQKIYGGRNKDVGQSVQQTTDGGYIVLGITNSNNGDVSGNHGGQDIWLLKLDGSGALLWQKTLGGTNFEHGSSIQQANDGGYIIAGSSYSSDGDLTENHGQSDGWVVKTSSTGEIEWQKTVGGSSVDGPGQVRQTFDGGYMLSIGSSSSNGDFPSNNGESDSWLFKLAPNGAIQWKKAYGGSEGEGPGVFEQTEDNGFIFAMNTASNNGDVTGNHGLLDYWVAKLDATGEIQWKTTLGGALDDRPRSIRKTVDGGYIVAGDSRSYNLPGYHGGNAFDFWVLELNASGTVQWQRMLGGGSHETGGYIQADPEGNFILAGSSVSNDGDVSGNHGSQDAWVLKLGNAVGVIETDHLIGQLDITPNPTSTAVYLSMGAEKTPWMQVQVSDMAGRLLHQQPLSSGEPMDVSQLPNGVYLLRATTAGGSVFQARLSKQN